MSADDEHIKEEGPRKRPVARPKRDDDDLEEDIEDLRKRRRRGGSADGADDVVSHIIPYRNGMALGAYYCGIFGLIPCVGLILGAIALVLGILGLRFAKANPEAHGTGHAIAGIVLGSLEILGHIGVIAGGVIWGIVAKR